MIIAWQLSDRNDVILVLDTIDQWTRKRDVSEVVFIRIMIMTSETSQAFNKRLEASTSKAAPLVKQPVWITHASNPAFHISKQRSCIFISVSHQAVEDYTYLYNYQRFQAKLKQRAPIEYRHALAA
ncbi:hypothetical protein PMSD_21435 [Paenibacillus macquariensis subsp. defensor]|nr:hypothetical protein PMSD_21435 [Paenibacillus macquariensis subsp. defensor]